MHPFPPLEQAFAIQDHATVRRFLADAIESEPHRVNHRMNYAVAWGAGSRYSSARAAFAQILADTPPPFRLQMAGKIGVEWHKLGRHDLAEPLLREALEGLTLAPLYEALANTLEHLNRLDESQSVLAEGLHRHPGHPGLLLALGRTFRRTGAHDRAEESLKKTLASPTASPTVKSKANYEWGHLCDTQGKYARAYQAFSRGKSLQRPALVPLMPLWQQILAANQDLSTLPTASDFKAWAHEACPVGNAVQPLAFLVGCPRSGTTLLERVLHAHPQIVTASETAILNSEVWLPLLQSLGPVTDRQNALARVSPWQAAMARHTYWSILPDALEEPVGNRLVIDKNPSLFNMLPITNRLFPRAKTIIALRDPRDIAWSCFTQHLPPNADAAGYLDLGTTCASVAVNLSQWIALRPRLATPWHEIRYENIVRNLTGNAQETLQFLDLPWQENVLAYHTQTDLIRSPSYAQASKPIYTHAAGRWHHYEEFFAPHMNALKPAVRELGY